MIQVKFGCNQHKSSGKELRKDNKIDADYKHQVMTLAHMENLKFWLNYFYFFVWYKKIIKLKFQ